MRERRGRLAVTVVAFVLGLLLVVQFRAQNAAGGLANLSTQDLTTLIANLNDRNGQLRDQVATLEGQLQTLRAQGATGQGNVGDLEADLARIRTWSGLDPAQGPGVVVSLSGPIDPGAVQDILNELRLAGAEALAVDAFRVVPGTVVAGSAGQLTVEGHGLASPLQISAIGDQANLEAVLTRPGGIISQIGAAQPQVTVEVRASTSPLVLPATHRDLVPADGKPAF